MDCVLPVTGSDPLPLVLIAVLLLGAGVALMLGVRRRGVGGGAAVVVAFALASAALVVSDARGADAQECPSSTTVTPTAAPTTIAVTTTAAATTTATSSTTTTVAATTTTTVVGGGVPTNPTFPTTTAATTTTVAAPDLTPTSIAGLQTLLFNDGPWIYTIVVENIGTVPTNGSTMTFTVSFPFTIVGPGGSLIDVVIDTSSASWTMSVEPGTLGSPGSPGTPTRVTFTSTSGFVLAAGANSSVIVVVDVLGSAPANFTVDVVLPAGIGGETNGGNNTATRPVVVNAPPG